MESITSPKKPRPRAIHLRSKTVLSGWSGQCRRSLVLITFLLATQTRPLLGQDASESAVWPTHEWSSAAPADVGLDGAALRRAREYALTGQGSGLITRHGRAVLRWGDQQKKYDLKSTSKSIGVTALGLAIADGKLSLEDRAVDRHPEFAVPPEANRGSPWRTQITLWHLATQTAGFEKPGGYTKLAFAPGTRWAYSDGGPNWLAECVTLAYGRDVSDLLFDRVFTPLGIASDDLSWRNNAYRPHSIAGVPRREFGSGVHANVDAMARIGYLYLRQGRWQDKQLIPAEFVKAVSHPVPAVVGLPEVDPDNYGNASDHYGLLWWNNADGTLAQVPRDAFWSWGLYDSLIVVIPSLDIVVARAGKSWKRQEQGGHYRVLEPFFEPIVQAVVDQAVEDAENEDAEAVSPPASAAVVPTADHPPSPVIRRVQWTPAESIVRLARGSDNWPLTWADDDALYTAYGDGRGFHPFVERKLSLGLARITGSPPRIRGTNLRSPSIELLGDGARGGKASGLLMVDGVLYLCVRNRDHAQLAYSSDRGQTWSWCDWRFTTSFGCPTFLNFGSNYSGARDDFVYVYSMDSDTAYERADRMVLARVPQGRIRDRHAYEFLEAVDAENRPRWTPQIARRGAVFVDPGNCYRSSVTYNTGLQRYLWCQTKQGDDTRFRGGFAIYDAPEPWGPWTEVFATERWDVGPGESSSLPTKWMSADGRTAHLVFSGDDCFSVRRLTFETRESSR